MLQRFGKMKRGFHLDTAADRNVRAPLNRCYRGGGEGDPMSARLLHCLSNSMAAPSRALPTTLISTAREGGFSLSSRGGCAFSALTCACPNHVAQSCTLLCRRFGICETYEEPNASSTLIAPQNAILRHNRWKICAT